MGQYFQSWQNFVFDCTVDYKKFIISSIKNSSLQPYVMTKQDFSAKPRNSVCVTILHEMSRMSAPYKLRKWAIFYLLIMENFVFLSNFDDLTCLKPAIIILRPEMGITPQYWSEITYHMIVITDYQIFCFQNGRWRLSWILGKTGANWDTFVIYRPGADDNRVRDSKQLCNLGLIFVIVTRAFNK